MTNLNFIKLNYDVISVMSLVLRHQKRHQNNVTRLFYFGPHSSKISGCTSAV